MGRPSKLTPELQESMCKMIRAGVHPETACQVLAIHRDSWFDWRRRGDSGEEPFATFLEETDRALGDINGRIEVEIVRATKRDWRAGAYILSHRMRDAYGDKATLEVTGPRGSQPVLLTDAAADLIARKLLHGERDSEPPKEAAQTAEPSDEP